MKTILTLTDFSEAAQHAAEFACRIAGALQAKRVLLYHAYRTIIGGTEIPVTVDSKHLYHENMQLRLPCPTTGLAFIGIASRRWYNRGLIGI